LHQNSSYLHNKTTKKTQEKNLNFMKTTCLDGMRRKTTIEIGEFKKNLINHLSNKRTKDGWRQSPKSNGYVSKNNN